MKFFLLPCVLAASGLVGAANAQALSGDAAYPTRPIRFVVPYFPGGTPERFSMFLESELAKYGRLVKEAGIKYE